MYQTPHDFHIMPRVDFYILPDATADGRLLYACRLTETAYARGHSIYLHSPSRNVAQHLDDLLWSYRQGSFLPHCLITEVLPPVAPILIGDERGPECTGIPLEETLARMHTLLLCPTTHLPWEGPAAPGALLINLAVEVPAFIDRFVRVAEIVDQNEQNLRAGRLRFTYYREHGITPENHKLQLSRAYIN